MGKFDDSIELAKGVVVPAKGERATPSLAGVNEALGSVTSALATSPMLVQSGKYADSVQKAKDIAAGKKDTSGGIGGLFKSTIGKGLEGLGYVAGLPARTVTSVVKETSDLFSGDGFSVKDLVTQPFESDFYASKFIPKTGNKWLDIAVGLGVDVLTDPVTYVSFGATLGRSGRIALAAKAGEAEVLAKAPSLANKFDDIVRYGEWALDDVEREALNIPKGLRWQFGQNSTIFNPESVAGKISGGVAEAVGKPFAGVRATIGDIPALNRVQGFVRPRSYGGALNALGRRAELDGVDILKEVSRYSAGIRFRAQRGLTQQMLLGDNEALLKELDNSPFRNTVFEVIEGSAQRSGRPISAEEQALADRVVNLFQGSRAEANKFTKEFANRRGVDADYIGFVDNYFHGSLSDEAQKFVSNRNFGKGKFDSELAKTIEVTPSEFITGPTIMRGRTLKAGENWLGEVLQFADKAEINRIAREKLGFDWFKTDARSVVSDYIDNISKQTGRIAFVDRLFDYGTDVVDKLLPKMVPDTELVATAKASYGKLNSAYNKIANSIDRLERSATATVQRVTGRAERAGAKGAEAGVALREEIAGLRQDVTDARKALTRGRRQATRKSNEVRAAFDTAVAPLETRILELENILKAGASQEELAATVLKDLHVRAFPDIEDAARPTKYADLVRDIKRGAVEKYNLRADVLNAEAEAGANVARKVGAAEGQYTKTINKAEGAISDIKAARESVRTAPPTTKPIDWEKLGDVPAELEGYLGTDAAQSLENWIYDAKFPKKWLDEVAGPDYQFDEHYRVLQQSLEDAGFPETVTVTRRGKPTTKGDVRNGSAFENWTGKGYGSDTTVYVSEVPRENIVGFGHLEEGEVFYKTEGVVTKEYKAGEVPPPETAEPRPSVKKELSTTKAEVNRQRRIMEKAIKDDPVVKNVKSLENAHTRAVNAVNAKEALLPDRFVWESTVKPELDAVVNSVKASVSGRNFAKTLVGNDREAATIITRQWVENADNAMKQLDALGILTPAERDVWERTLTAMRSAEVDLAKASENSKFAQAAVNALSDPASPLYGKMVSDVKDGWAAMERLGIQLPQETKDMLFRGIERFTKVDEVRDFLKIFNKYNQFFRVTAMLNPGFVVRNAYTAAFNNFVYGTTIKDTTDAIKFAYELQKNGVRSAMDAVPYAEREIYDRAYKGIIASGAGQIKDISTMPITDGMVGKLLNSRLVKVWGKANSDAEVGARMAMALRAARNGDNIDQIATTIARYHFDYSDLSKLDEIAKVFVPFWTYASRNIPLQIMNQVARPSMYRAYESARRNMPVDKSLILPSWLAERQPLGFGAGGVLNPDLPQVDMQEQIRQLSDPLRLLSQLYPQYRLPIELAGSRQLNLDIPFSDKPSEIKGPLDLPAALAGLLTGQTVDTAGGPAVTSKTAYAVSSAIPTLGLLQRLLPQAGGQEKYKDRQISSLISTLTGAPYRQVTAQEQENELLRRQFALRDLLDSLQRRGYA